MLSENMQRKDLSEVEKAEKIHELMIGDQSLSTRKISKKIGVNQGYIVKLLQLHNYPTEIKEEIKQGNVSADTIRSINKLDTPTEQIKVAKEIKEKDLNKKEVEQIVDFVKTAPEPIKEKLNTEPEYTIEQAKREVFEVEIITPNEYLDSEITFKETRGIIENEDLVKVDNFIKVEGSNLTRPQTDYYLTLDCVEEMDMMENLSVLRV